MEVQTTATRFLTRFHHCKKIIMAIVDKTTLKTYFETGDKPTESQFEDLIDSLAHTNDVGGGGGSTSISVATLNHSTVSAFVRYIGDSIPTLTGDASAGWEITCPSDSRLLGFDFNADSNDLDGSNDLIVLVDNDATGTDNLYCEPMIINMNNGQVVDKPTFGNTITITNPNAGETQYVFNNLSGFGVTGVKICFRF